MHDDSAAHAAAAAFEADACTRGHDISFAAGRYAPGTPSGDRLLAHELFHVTQFDEGRIATTGDVSVASRTAPQEAEAYSREDVVLARLPSPLAATRVETATPHSSVRRYRAVSTHVFRRTPIESPSSEPDSPKTAETESAAEDSGTALERLVAEFREPDQDAAVELIQRLAAHRPLEDAVSRLDEEGLLDRIVRLLGADAWREPARAATFAVLAARAPEANARTIAEQLSTGLAEVDLRVSGEEARLFYEILRGMSPAERAACLVTPEGQQAFDALPDRRRPGVRLSKELAFLDEDLEALLAELDVTENWTPEREPWLRTLFWMIVQSGHAGDPRVTAYVTDNWDTHGDFFAAQGLRPDGELTMQRLRETPRPRTLTFTGPPLALKSDWLGAIAILPHLLTDSWGRKPHVIENIPLQDLQKTLGGTLFGMRLDGFESAPVTGELTVGINPRQGELTIAVPSAVIPALSWGGEGLRGSISVTGRDVKMSELRVKSRWPARKTFADVDSLHLCLKALEIGRLVAASGRQETGRVTGLLVEDLTLDIELGPFRQGDGTHLFRTVRYLESQLDALMSALHAMAGTLVSTFTPPASSESSDLPAAFVAELARTLTEKLGGELSIVATVGRLRATGVTLHGAGSTAVDTGFGLVVAAGPRAIAELEAGRLRARGKKELSPEDQMRLAELEVAAANPDRESADSVLRSLGFEPDEVVLRVTTQAAAEEPGLQLSGIDLPIARTQLDEMAGQRAELVVTFPAAAATKAPIDIAPDATGPDGVPLYRIDLDVSEGAAPAGAATEVLGRPALAGPLHFAAMQGHADVFPDRRVQLDVTLHDVACERMDWGIAIAAPSGRAKTVHVHGAVQLADAGRFVVGDDAALAIDIDEVTADRITIDKLGQFRAVAQAPTLRGLHVVLADGELPSVRVESGTIAGFDGAVGAILTAGSDRPFAFRDFNLSAIVDLGIYQFSFAELETRTVDLDAAGRRLTVSYFKGAIEGVVSDQLGGKVSIRPKDDIVLGALSVHLNALSRKFGAVDLGWRSAVLHDATLDLTWAFLSPPSAEDRETAAPTVLDLTLSGLRAASVTATGLRLDTQLAGSPIAMSMDARGDATIFGLDVPSMELLIAQDFITAEGTVSGDALMAQGLVAKLGAALELNLVASSRHLRFDALSDGDMKFQLDDLIVSGTAVALSNGRTLRTWSVHVDAGVAGAALAPTGLEVQLDRPHAVVEGQAVDFTKIEALATQQSIAVVLGDGHYLGNHIEVAFDSLEANVVIGQPGDTPVALGNLQLALGPKIGAYPILKFTDIRLADASFEIDDLGALVGRKELIQMFPNLQVLAAQTSGRVTFQAELIDAPFSRLDVDATITAGQVHGTMDPVGMLPAATITGTLMSSLTQADGTTKMHLVKVIANSGLQSTIEVAWPPADPLPVVASMIPDPSIVGAHNIDVQLHSTPTDLLVPGAGELHVAAGSQVHLAAVGSTANGLAITLAVDPASARALLWEMLDFSAQNIRITQGVKVQVQFSGLAAKKVTGTIASGSIDAATIGVIEP